MPIDRGSHISALIEEIKHHNPGSILDIGCGFGLMGTVFRAYTDIRLSELDPKRYHPVGWRTKIHGVEIYEKYRNPAWLVYDAVYTQDAIQFLAETPVTYDLIYCGDVIEHFPKDKGEILIKRMLHKGKTVILATPSPAPAQDEILGNIHEKHLSSWDEKDFANQNCQSHVLGSYNGILMVKLWRE